MQMMFYALTAIGLMFVTNFSIVYARKTGKKLFQGVLYLVAFTSLIAAFIFMLAVLATF